MKVLLDTNIVMDIIEEREPFYNNSIAVLKLISAMNADCYFNASSAKDVFYLVKKHTGDLILAKKAIVSISKFAIFCDTTKQDIQEAILSNIIDFEDAVLVAGAIRDKIDFIITRNVNDFADSAIPVITPADFLKQNQNDTPTQPPDMRADGRGGASAGNAM
jgi:predicted nucleic acid-binding protein